MAETIDKLRIAYTRTFRAGDHVDVEPWMRRLEIHGIDGQRVAITVWVVAAETIPPKISEIIVDAQAGGR